MVGRWFPLHENHAINVMALAIKFVEPIPAPLFRKALGIVGGQAERHGFLDRQQTNTAYEFKIERGIPLPPKQITSGGVLFSAYVESENGNVLGRMPSEQVQIEENSIVYRTWDYISWTWQKDRIIDIIGGCIDALSGIIAVSSIRIEYQDRFYFDGPAAEAVPRSLLRNGSEFLSPHIMDKSELWHSHTGMFFPRLTAANRLLQINVDAVDEENDTGEVKRWVNIMTARENRYPGGAENAVALDLQLLSSDIEEEHLELKNALADILSDDAAKQIYLKD